MAPDEDHAFSDLEVEQVHAVVEGWFRSESDWTVRNVTLALSTRRHRHNCRE